MPPPGSGNNIKMPVPARTAPAIDLACRNDVCRDIFASLSHSFLLYLFVEQGSAKSTGPLNSQRTGSPAVELCQIANALIGRPNKCLISPANSIGHGAARNTR